MGLVIAGKSVEIPGLETQDYLSIPSLRLKPGEDMKTRSTGWIRSVVLHTSKGVPGGSDRRPQKILPGLGPRVDAGRRVTRYWSKDGRNAGAHLIVDFDGLITCCADLERDSTFHAGNVNPHSIGCEIYQGSDAEMYEGQLEIVVKLCDFLTRRFGIQRQFHWPYRSKPIPRFEQNNAVDFVGIFGHRDCSSNRGFGDPGDAIFDCLFAAGYERWDAGKSEDRTMWRARQRDLIEKGFARDIVVDGIPGPSTVEALKKAGHKVGLLVSRPGD